MDKFKNKKENLDHTKNINTEYEFNDETSKILELKKRQAYIEHE